MYRVSISGVTGIGIYLYAITIIMLNRNIPNSALNMMRASRFMILKTIGFTCVKPIVYYFSICDSGRLTSMYIVRDLNFSLGSTRIMLHSVCVSRSRDLTSSISRMPYNIWS